MIGAGEEKVFFIDFTTGSDVTGFFGCGEEAIITFPPFTPQLVLLFVLVLLLTLPQLAGALLAEAVVVFVPRVPAVVVVVVVVVLVSKLVC